MKIIIAVLIEQIHRYIFDNLYDQKHHFTLRDKIILSFYNQLTNYCNNWRFILHSYNFKRYSDYDRRQTNSL